MKITKRYLKKIIKEELQHVLQELDMAAADDESNFAPDWQSSYGTLAPGADDYDPLPGGGTADDWDEVEEFEGSYGGPAPEGGMTHGEFPQSVDPAEQDADHARAVRRARAVKGTGAIRRMINAMEDKGEIDNDTWRRARRALYKGDGGESAKAIVLQGRRSKYKRARAGTELSPGGMADLASGGTYVDD